MTSSALTSTPVRSGLPDRVSPAGRWAYRLALATALASIPLIVFGGSVTTLGAGMAVEGWLHAEGHFMPFFPVEKWFRDTGTMVEHTHRLFGVLVGLLAIGTVIAGWVSGRRALPIIGLLAVCGQGALGGFRVLENSPQLAFLHGALAQAVFACLCVVALILSPRWISAEAAAAVNSPAGKSTAVKSPLSGSAWFAVLAVYVQIVIGAWYRHGLRASETGIALRLALHFAGAFVVFIAVLAIAKRVRLYSSRWRGSTSIAPLQRAGKRAAQLLAFQVLLGLFAWATRNGTTVTAVEWIVTVLHVLTGGLLLAQCTILALSTRHYSEQPQPSDIGLAENSREIIEATT